MMTCLSRRGGVPLYASLLALLLLSGPVFARTGDSNGPLYTSNGQIEVAQRVLRSENYLQAGRYTPGRMDDATSTALRAFQRDHFIPDSGMLDQDTMAQLMSHQAARATTPAPAPEANPAPRAMPVTASPVPLMTVAGALLLTGGLLLVRRRRA